MACIVYQIDKKTGTKFAYESVSYWDKELWAVVPSFLAFSAQYDP